ncbi:MAG: sodium:proton antiporter NhaD [Bacteroidia bacterium]|nr:sodium:proton antiporter NhaD [Bacteroidia bacterium]
MTFWIVLVFIIGYGAITLEHALKINKSAAALITGVLTWTLYIVSGHDHEHINAELMHHLGEAAGIIFFLLGAMVIVEIIDAHEGFNTLVEMIRTSRKSQLVWIISIMTFVLSAILDNLTTTIVMVSLVRRLLRDREDRLMMAGMIVIAANAGGAFSPIGDVTTTMLWIKGYVSTGNIILALFLPSVACLLVPLVLISRRMQGTLGPMYNQAEPHQRAVDRQEQRLVLLIGIGALVFTPIFKTITHLPPFMGILLGLGVVWVVTDLMHHGHEEAYRDRLSILHALRRIDAASVLFFLGILLAVGTLESLGILRQVAGWMDQVIGNVSIVAILIGILSAIVDNVPLVAAAMGMYSLETYPPDHYFWEFIAYTAGTGGSILVIGSAAGVAAMGMEKIDFFWYLRRISLPALLGYLAGAGVYMLQYSLTHPG